jgi:hypothetical protein
MFLNIFSPLAAGNVKDIFALVLGSSLNAHRTSFLALPVLAWARNW